MARTTAAIREVSKAYPSTLACRLLTVEFNAGEIHALLGENGAGKSTVVKILSGILRPDSGHVEVDGRVCHFRSVKDARRAGIGVVQQAGSLIRSMTVLENLRLVGEPAADLKERVGNLGIGLAQTVRDLSPRQRRLLEVHRLLAQKVRVLVLDEPTAMLSVQDSQLLFVQLRQLADEGYAVVVVSHKLPEILEHSDRITVLRRGEVQARLGKQEASATRLIALISGSMELPGGPGANEAPSRPTPPPGPPLLRLEGIETDGVADQEAPLRRFALQLHRGEILGLAGRPGSGIVTVLHILSGKKAALGGGRVVWLTGDGAVARGRVGLMPADGIHNGMIPRFTIGQNLALRHRRLLGWTKINQMRRSAARLIRRYRIQPPDPDRLLLDLSGGNAQKILVAREMEYADDLLLAINPTAGLDFAAARTVHDLFRERAAAGGAIVLHSEDLDELTTLCSRIVVLSRGCRVAELSGQPISRLALGAAIAEEPELARLPMERGA